MEVIRPDELDQAEAVHRFHQRIGGPRDLQTDVAGQQTVVQLAKPCGGAGVQAGTPAMSSTKCRVGLGAASTAAQTRRLQKWTLAKNNRSENR